MVAGAISTIAGLAICLFVMLKNEFLPSHFVHGELDVRTIGHALMGMEKYQYILPFEVISVLLLACIVGGILIARKDRTYGTHGILSGGFHLYDVAGIYGFFTRRNLLAMLISVELILNSVDINFAVFNRYLFPEELEGFFSPCSLSA